MKKFLIWIASAVAVVVIFEIVFGRFVSSYMDKHSLPGDFAATDHVLRHFNEDILVLGSSVAKYSADAEAIEDSTGLTSYNGGGRGQMPPFFNTLLKAAVGQHVPKHVVLLLTEGNLSSADMGDYDLLSPYYDMNIADIDSILNTLDSTNKFKLKSALLRFNSKWLKILLYAATEKKQATLRRNGSEVMPLPSAFPNRWAYEFSDTITENRQRQLEEFIGICKTNGIQLNVAFTPRFINKTEPLESPLVESVSAICEKYGVKFHNDSRMEPFDSDSTLFYDNIHLNYRGAKVYTNTIIKRI